MPGPAEVATPAEVPGPAEVATPTEVPDTAVVSDSVSQVRRRLDWKR